MGCRRVFNWGHFLQYHTGIKIIWINYNKFVLEYYNDISINHKLYHDHEKFDIEHVPRLEQLNLFMWNYKNIFDFWYGVWNLVEWLFEIYFSYQFFLIFILILIIIFIIICRIIAPIIFEISILVYNYIYLHITFNVCIH